MSAARPLFDPDRVKAPDDPVARGLMTVSQLTGLIKDTLSRHLPATLSVVGELSNVSVPSSGHLYFTLKDPGSEVRCVMWRSDFARIKFEPRDGMEVVVTGGIDVYEPRGQYQLYARRIEPRGVGALELAFRQLCEKLSKEGLFDAARKRSLPRWPRRIAVVTSATGAAIRDILHVLRRRYPCVDVLVYPVRVQGEGAAEEIASAIRTLSAGAARLGGIDVMIVGRGGGSLEDLWAFNEETVARAIVASTIPVVSAVGHEVDVTISDLVADVRAPTPSAAAELVVPVLDDVLAMLGEKARTLHRHARHAVDVSASRLTPLERHEWLRDPAGRITRHAQRVDEFAARMKAATAHRFAAAAQALRRCETALSAIRPEAYIQRQHRRLLEALHGLRWALGRLAQREERRIGVLAERLHRASPQRRVEHLRTIVPERQRQLSQVLGHRVALAREQIEGLSRRLASVGYKQVLARGYSITRLAKRRTIVAAAAQVAPGDRIVTETADGQFESRVIDDKQLHLFE